MRIPFPVRVAPWHAFAFGSVLLVLQLAEGTEPVFAVTALAFLMTCVLAFNVAGGLSRPSGAYILAFALLTVELGLLWKAVLGQPANSNLRSPETTMVAYLVGAVALLVAAYLKRQVVREPTGVADWLGVANVDLGHVMLGCFLFFYMIVFANTLLPNSNGSLLSIFNQLNQFWPLGILIGTIHAVKISHGQRSTTAISLLAMLHTTIFGTLFFSKQGMFTAWICWLIGVAYTGYRLRLWQVGLLFFAIWFSSYGLTPISQLGRARFQGGDMGDRADVVIDMLTHMKKTHDEYASIADFYDQAQGATTYFGTSQGLMDRLTMIAVDDSLIHFSAEGHKLGYYVIGAYLLNWVPHFILPNKMASIIYGGNYYTHEMGGLSPDDYTTGISFSPVAEGFHLDGLRGILAIGIGVWTVLFTTTDLLAGDLRRQPWGLLAVLMFAHIAPETMFIGPINFIWFGNIGLILAVVICGFLAPVLGVLIGGPRERRHLRGLGAAGGGLPAGVVAPREPA